MNGSHSRVLLGEDDYDARQIESVLLRDYYPLIEIIEAVNGIEAVSMAMHAMEKLGGLDLVIMDNGMPGLSGLAASRQIRKAYPALPIIMFTANPDPMETKRAGITTLIPKGEVHSYDLLLAEASKYLKPPISSGSEPVTHHLRS